MAKNVYVLLVMYRKYGERSAACESLRRFGFSNVLVMDNSEDDFDTEAYCRELGWSYIKMPGNSGFSRAYNVGIDYLKGKADYVVLLDDDTALGQTYIGALHYAVVTSPETRIFLPTVKDRKGILSPCRARRWGVHRTNDPASIPPQELSGIGSGMALAISIFDDYAFDERYFVDFVDHAFLRDMRARGETVELLDTELTRRFSDMDGVGRDKILARFKLFCRDCRVYYGDSWLGRIYASLVLLRRRMGISRELHRAAHPKDKK